MRTFDTRKRAETFASKKRGRIGQWSDKRKWWFELRGIECQLYAWGPDGKCVYATPRRLAKITRKTIVKDYRRWRAWRVSYLADNPGDYPLRTNNPTVKTIGVFDIATGSQLARFDI
jgi:hypothetical protein